MFWGPRQKVRLVAGLNRHTTALATPYRSLTMKTFKTLAAALCLATAAIASFSAEAGMRANGIQINGIQINGIQINGIQINGFVLNGFVLNGRKQNGFYLNGTFNTGIEAGTVVAVTLPE